MVREGLSRAASPAMRELRKRRRARRRASPKVRREGDSGADEQGLRKDLVMAVADSFITFCWVVSGASVAVIANVLAKELGWGNIGKTTIMVALALVVLPTFIAVGRWMGGASWNSVGLVALASLGVGHVTFLSILIRLPAQACHLTTQTNRQSSSVVSGMLENDKGFKIGVFASLIGGMHTSLSA